MKRALLAITLVCATSVVQAAEAAKPVHGLHMVDKAWVKAMLANDAAACAALYADDAVLVLPGSAPIKGKKAIAEAYAGWLSQVKVVEVDVPNSEYRSSGNVSAGWGTFKVVTVPRAGGSPTTETGTWCAVAEKKNGTWKYVSDHASDDPAPASK